MVGYTQGGLSQVLFPKFVSHPQKYMMLAIIPQSIGLIFAVFCLKSLLKRFNIKHIFSLGLVVAAFILIFIGLINKIVPNSNSWWRLIIFCFLEFFLGVSIGPISPLVTTYFGARYQGKAQIQMISLSCCVYGMGAGIIPLFLAPVIINFSHSGFAPVSNFYFISACFAICGFIFSFFIDYQHQKQHLSHKIIDNQIKNYQKNIWKPILLMVTIMGLYVFAETIVNYSYSNSINFFNKNEINNRKNISILAIQSFGIVVFTQGFYNIISGVILSKFLKQWKLIIFNTIILLATFIAIICNILMHKWGIIFISIVIGIGLGNLWSLIYSYGIGICRHRVTHVGIWLNIVAMVTIPVTQILCAGINNISITDLFVLKLPFILAIVACILIISGILFSLSFFKKRKIKRK